MLKKLWCTLLVVSLVFSLTGCKKDGEKDGDTAPAPQIVVVNETSGTTANTVTGAESEEKSDLDLIGEFDVEREIFDVKITIPKEYCEGDTQESLDEEVKKNGWKSATLNEDGTVTYEMTKKQHKEMMKELEESFNAELTKMCTSGDYPSYVSITAFDNFTKFKVVSRSTELGLEESIFILGLYMYGGMYNIFNGTDFDNIHIDFVNEATGEVFNTADSKDVVEN